MWDAVSNVCRTRHTVFFGVPNQKTTERIIALSAAHPHHEGYIQYNHRFFFKDLNIHRSKGPRTCFS